MVANDEPHASRSVAEPFQTSASTSQSDNGRPAWPNVARSSAGVSPAVVMERSSVGDRRDDPATSTGLPGAREPDPTGGGWARQPVRGASAGGVEEARGGLGELGAPVLLEEVATSLDGGVGLAGRARYPLEEHLLAALRDGIGVGERTEERTLEA